MNIRFAVILVGAMLMSSLYVWAENERYYQEKINNEIFHGKLEVVLPHGRADIINDEYAVEVDWARKWVEGIRQCLVYANDTKKKPGLVLIVDKKSVPDIKKLTKAKMVCWLMDIKLWVVKK